VDLGIDDLLSSLGPFGRFKLFYWEVLGEHGKVTSGEMSLGLVVGSVQGLVAHRGVLVAEMLALVHRQTTSTTTEAVALGAKLAAIALLAEDVTSVLADVRRVEFLVAESALEA